MNATSPATNCMPLHHPDMAYVQMYGKEEVFSLPTWSKDKVNSSKTPQNKGENRVAKRKLYSPGGALSEDEDKKVTPKRRRSLIAGEESSSSTPPPPTAGHQSGSTGGGSSSAVKSGKSTPGGPGGGGGTPRLHTVPLSERQQMHLLMQMTADELHPDRHSPYSSSGVGVGAGGLSHGCHPTSSGPMSPHSVGRRTPLSASASASSTHSSGGDRKLHKRNERGETPLHLAAIKGDVKQTKKLIGNGVDVNIADYAGWTPLHEACNLGFLKVARQLINAGADVNIQGLDKDTPLHDAAVNGHVDLVKLLLKHGADPLQSNGKGKTPIDVAHNDEILRLLQQRPDSNQVSSGPAADRLTGTARAVDCSDDGTMSPPMSSSPASAGSSSPRSSGVNYEKSAESLSPAGSGIAVSSTSNQHGSNSIIDSSRSSVNCSSRRPASSMAAAASGSTPPSSGVLKNFHVSHRMSGSQLTFKYEHVKRNENGLASTIGGDRVASDIRQSSKPIGSTGQATSRLHGHHGSLGGDVSNNVKNQQQQQQTSPSATASRRSPSTTCNGGVAPQNGLQNRVLNSSIPDSSVQANPGPAGGCQNENSDELATQQDVGRSAVAGNNNTMTSSASEETPTSLTQAPIVTSAPSLHNQQPITAAATKPFSPQFEDISDAEDDTTTRPPPVVSAAPIVPLDAGAAGLCRLAPLQAQLTPLSAGMYQVPTESYTASASFFSAATAGGPLTAALPLGSWSGYIQPPSLGQLPQPAPTSTIVPPVVGRPPFFAASPWMEVDQLSYQHVMCRAPSYGAMVGNSFEVAAMNVSPSNKPVNAAAFDTSSIAELPPSKSCISSISTMSMPSSFPRKVETDVSSVLTDSKFDAGVTCIKDEIDIKTEISTAHEDLAGESRVCKMEIESSIPNTEVKPTIGTFAAPEIELSPASDLETSKSCSLARAKEIGPCVDHTSVYPSDGLSMSVKIDRCGTDAPMVAGSPSSRASPKPAGGRPESAVDTSSSGSRPSTPAAAPATAAVPKVPPLRIIIPPKSSTTSSAADSCNSNTVVTSKASSAGSLPYIVNVPQDAEIEESLNSDRTNDGDQSSENESAAGQVTGLSESEMASKDSIAAAAHQYDSIMTRRRKIRQPKKDEEKVCPRSDVTAVACTAAAASEDSKQRVVAVCSETDELAAARSDDQGSATTSERRVTRAAARSQNQHKGTAPSKERVTKTTVDKDVTSCTSRNDVEKDSSNGHAETSSGAANSTGSGAVLPEDDANGTAAAIPRKHKKLHRAAAPSDSPAAENHVPVVTASHPFRKPTNPYSIYMSIKTKVAERKNRLSYIVPKPPAHFSEYSLIKRRYVLHDAANTGQQVIPTLTAAPSSLTGPLRQLFNEQEQARHQLKLQHIKERERLALLYEQETLRVHCHSARAHADSSHSAVLSVCSLLSIEEGLYGGGTTSQGCWAGCASGFVDSGTGGSSHEDRDQRARYGTRHFFTWMQDVQEKFHRLKGEMCLRHHHEADVLCAVQRLDWEWKLREIGTSAQTSAAITSTSSLSSGDDPSDVINLPTSATSVEIYVPLVTVEDDLDFLPV